MSDKEKPPRTTILFAVILKAQEVALNRRTAAGLGLPAEPVRFSTDEVFAALLTPEEIPEMLAAGQELGATPEDIRDALLIACREAHLENRGFKG